MDEKLVPRWDECFPRSALSQGKRKRATQWRTEGFQREKERRSAPSRSMFLFSFFFAFCRAGDLADNLARIFAFIDLLHRAISDLSGHSPFIWRYDYATLKKSRLFSEKVFKNLKKNSFKLFEIRQKTVFWLKFFWLRSIYRGKKDTFCDSCSITEVHTPRHSSNWRQARETVAAIKKLYSAIKRNALLWITSQWRSDVLRLSTQR